MISFDRILRSAGVVLALLPALPASASTSANYSLDPLALTGAGGPAQSANYGQFSVVGGFAVGSAAAGAYDARYGYHLRGATGVVGRLVFYNRSAWDGNNAAANAADDGAIATNKTALLPGGAATFANYTSYSRGLNGLMVDLELSGAPTAADFAFKVGNNNSPAGWAAGPAPSVVAVRGNAGSNGTDRVTLVWADNTIQKQWLQVTVLASAATGLGAPDVFYYGNAIGETGNNPANGFVDGGDESATRANPRGILNPAPLDFAYDFNRDKLVNGTDVSILRANATGVLTALRLITPAGGDAPLGDVWAAVLPPEARLEVVLIVPEGGRAGASGPRPAAAADNAPVLAFRLAAPGVGRAQVRVQAAAALDAPWQDLAPQPALRDDGTSFHFELPDATAGQQFFRIQIAPNQPN